MTDPDVELLDLAIAQEQIYNFLVEEEIKHEDYIQDVIGALKEEERRNAKLREEEESQRLMALVLTRKEPILEEGPMAHLFMDCIRGVMNCIHPRLQISSFLFNKHWYSNPDRQSIRESAKGLRWCTYHASMEAYIRIVGFSNSDEIVASMIMSVIRNRLNILEWLVTNQSKIVEKTLGVMLLIAAVYGRDDIGKWLLPKVIPTKEYSLYNTLLKKLEIPDHCGLFVDYFLGTFQLDKFLSGKYPIWPSYYGDSLWYVRNSDETEKLKIMSWF